MTSPIEAGLSYLPHSPTISLVDGSAGSPMVFLLDEYHSNSAVIEENIAIAKQLVSRERVRLIGVEDRPAKRDFGVQETSDSYFLPMPPQARQPRPFERAMLDEGFVVVGVDSPSLLEKVISDRAKWSHAPIDEIPAQIERSNHFIRSFFEQFSAQGQSGNGLICCGTAHNLRIMALARLPRSSRPSWVAK
jgi:hypothetical protein